MASGTETVGVRDARTEIARGDAVAVDVRSEEEWGEGHIPGAIHLPDGDSEQAAGGNLPDQGARLMVIARNGGSASEAAKRLSDVQPTEDPDEETELGAG